MKSGLLAYNMVGAAATFEFNMENQSRTPSPALFFNTVSAYQRTSAIKAAIELDVFTAIGSGVEQAALIAQKCQTSERGMRILCDYLTIVGFLIKEAGGYKLTPDSAVFLVRDSKAYIGGHYRIHLISLCHECL